MSTDRKGWAREHLRGVENITLPSFDAEFRALDEAGIRFDVRTAIEHGFSSTLCACDAGLSPREMRQLVEVAVDEAAGRLHVGVWAPTDSVAVAAEVVAHARSVGASHALVTLPLTVVATDQDAVHGALGEICAASDLPVVLDVQDGIDLHALHASNIPLDAYDRLAELPNVVGLRIATPDPAPLYEAFRRYGDRLVVGLGSPALVGAFDYVHRLFGAQWLAAAHWELWQSPQRRYVVDIVDAVMDGRNDEARGLYWRVAPALGVAMGAGLVHPEVAGMAHWPLAKYVSWSVGGNGGLTRDPAMRLKDHQVRARQTMLQILGIDGGEPLSAFLTGRASA